MSVRGFRGIAALQLKQYKTPRSIPVIVAGRYNQVAYCAVSSPELNTREPKMEQEKQTRPSAELDESKTHKDVMVDSFGVEYSTRSDEEGFGGIYKADDPDMNPGQHNHSGYNKSQGAEVKEKEEKAHKP